MTGPRTRIRGELLSLRFPPAELANRIYELEAENERLREALRRCGELAMSRKTGAIKHLVKQTLGITHFSGVSKDSAAGGRALSGSGESRSSASAAPGFRRTSRIAPNSEAGNTNTSTEPAE